MQRPGAWKSLNSATFFIHYTGFPLHMMDDPTPAYDADNLRHIEIVNFYHFQGFYVAILG